MGLSPRERRLRSDHEAMLKLAEESSIISFTTQGAPPDRYHVTFRGTGIARETGRQDIVLRDEHHVLIGLTAAYPRMIPELIWKTPIFHPNISAGGVVCLGGYQTNWVPSLRLDELCLMLWDMLRFANYDVESPYNREAALWAKNYRSRFPVDQRPLRNLTVERGRINETSAAQSLVRDSNALAPHQTEGTGAATGSGNRADVSSTSVAPDSSALERISTPVPEDVVFIDAEIVEPTREASDILFID